MLHNFILTTVYVLFTFIVQSKSAERRNELVNRQKMLRQNQYQSTSSEYNGGGSLEYDQIRFLNRGNQYCWVNLNAKATFELLDNLDEKYANARQSFQKVVEADNDAFDSKLLHAMLSSRGRISGQRGDIDDIPAGLNLGGYCMMRMEQSVLFFHRMKLRNNTRFRINYLNTDLHEMQIAAQLSLNDLHLFGSYERAITDKDPSILYYAPTYGQVEILLRNVEYKMEGRLRLLEDSLFVVLVNSEITFYDALMIYKNNASHYAKPISIKRRNIDEFTDRMKSDLDEWLRDYFNEHLVFFTEVGTAANDKFREYEKEKTKALNKYTDNTLLLLHKKLRSINATSVKLPNFSIYSVTGMEIKLLDGVLRGLNTMYRRSVATSKKEDDNIRMVDAILGFSSLKVIYKYNAFLTTGVPPLSGHLILSADELTVHMALTLLKDPETVDLQFDFIKQMKPESLTVEGPANRMIANFKHILEYHIISIMTNTLFHNIRALRTLTKCEPNFYGHVDSDEPIKKQSLWNSHQQKSKDGAPHKLKGSPDYVVHKEDSIEVELPPNANGETKKVHLAHVESLNITKLNK